MSEAESGGPRPASGYRHSITVPEADIDDLGHVNNTVYLRYIEDVCRAHSDRIGLSIERYRELGAVPVIHRQLVTYHRSARVGDELVVSTQVVSLGGVRARRHNEVRLAESRILLVEADTDWVWIDPETERPRRVPAPVFAAVGPLGEGAREGG